MTCKDVVDLLLEYVESTLGDDDVAELERHLAGCPACVAYLKTYRKTQELTSEVTRVPMPEEMKARLRRLLLEQLAKGAS